MQSPERRKHWVKELKVFLLIFGGVCLCGMIGLVFLVGNIFADFCGNKQVGLSYSTDEKYKAIVFSRDCGATTGYSTHVAVVPAKEQLNDQTVGNAFVIDGGGPPEPEHVIAAWTGPRRLEITHYGGPRVFHKKEEVSILEPMAIAKQGTFVDTITISYKTK